MPSFGRARFQLKETLASQLLTHITEDGIHFPCTSHGRTHDKSVRLNKLSGSHPFTGRFSRLVRRDE